LTVGFPLELGLGHEREERQQELVLGRYRRMREDHRPLRVDSAREVVHDHVEDVVSDVGRGVAIGDDLVVGDDDVRLDPEVLKPHALRYGAEVVAHVETSRGAVAGEHDVSLGVLG
jgi:hypothetical protein